jgi:hypothetical protein
MFASVSSQTVSRASSKNCAFPRDSAVHPALLDSLAGLDAVPSVAAQLFQTPVFRFPLDIASGVPRLIDPPPVDWHLPAPMVAKLGAKSWRDDGSLRVLGEERPFMAQANSLLAAPTEVQQRYLAIVRTVTAQLDLALFAYRDFTSVSEFRWRVVSRRATCTSRCLRGRSAALADGAVDPMRLLALRVAATLGTDAIVDLVLERSGRVSILEVNPDFRSRSLAAPSARSPSR